MSATESATLRIALLAALGGAAAAAAIGATRAHQPLSLGASPAAAAPTPVSHRTAARRARRCVASAGAESRVDRQLAHLVAPVTTTRLARPLRTTPRLGEAARLFPLPRTYARFPDTFGAARAGVSWHHGDDLFAPRGTPVVAVADGVVFSVGWQRLGGRRLWLIDRDGNEYYYAHLERYSALARDGREVAAGDVLGYVGTTGDAEGTPPHLHFEIHPATLLGLGYDGAVDPTSYLRAWARLPPDAAAPVVTSARLRACSRRRSASG
jgi:murein DD-endopeptidase MepM/ murein hydrolase activator NlpD